MPEARDGDGRGPGRADRPPPPGGPGSLSAVTSERSPLEITEHGDGSARARLSGDLDIVTSDDVKRELAQLIDDGQRTLTLDLSGVGFVDSSGLGALVALHRHAEAAGGTLTIRAVPAQVQRLFEITRLGDLLTVVGD
jgi:anti-sigma B factor antagonist